MTTIRRGRVLRDTSLGEGLVFVEGTQYSFRLEGMWRSEFAPSVNMPVDAVFDEQGQLVALTTVALGTLGREQAALAFDAAGNAVQALTGQLQAKGLPFAKVWARRTGYDTLAATLLLIVAWFWLPALSIGIGILGEHALSFYQVLAFLDGGFLGLAGGHAGSYGVLVLVALLGVFLPQFWKDPRAGYGMALPLALTLVAATMAFERAGSLLGVSAWRSVSFGSGLHLALATGCYLAFRGLSVARGHAPSEFRRSLDRAS